MTCDEIALEALVEAINRRAEEKAAEEQAMDSEPWFQRFWDGIQMFPWLSIMLVVVALISIAAVRKDSKSRQKCCKCNSVIVPVSPATSKTAEEVAATADSASLIPYSATFAPHNGDIDETKVLKSNASPLQRRPTNTAVQESRTEEARSWATSKVLPLAMFLERRNQS